MRLHLPAAVAALGIWAASAEVGPLQPVSSSTCLGLRQPSSAPGELIALVEIPAGGVVKYEMDLISGWLVVDRLLPDSLPYPENYGMIPCTLAGDGDPLDMIILSDAPLIPGTLVRVRPIGVLPMQDDGRQDDKILGLALTARNGQGDPIRSLSQVPAERLARIHLFFLTYKGPAAAVHLGPWADAGVAVTLVRDALARAAGRGEHR
jgi:inorganic pyrophosphatase